MDIGSLFTKDTADVVIKDPVSGKDTDFVVTMCSVVSDQYRKAVQANAKRGSDADPVEFLADLTVDWKGADHDGKAYKFSRENAVSLYRNSAVIKNQVDIALSQPANFLLNA